MSYDTDRYQLTRLSGQSLAVIECGVQICHPAHLTPRTVYPYYSIHFILEGKGVFRTGKRTYQLSAGEGFLITPNMICDYEADKNEPWKYVYATFLGPDDDALVQNAGLDSENCTFSFPLEENYVKNIYKMHAAGKENEGRGYEVIGYFLLLMSGLIKENQSVEKRLESKEDYVRHASIYIKNHLPEIRSVEQVAKHVNVDRSYLYRLFLKYRSVSPSEYLLECRLKRAEKLLENSELSMSEIADFVGFYDTSHFYRAFLSKYGTTPQKYLKSKDGGIKA